MKGFLRLKPSPLLACNMSCESDMLDRSSGCCGNVGVMVVAVACALLLSSIVVEGRRKDEEESD